MLVLIWVTTFWKGSQQTTKVAYSKEKVKNLKLLSPKPWLIFAIILVKFLKENSFIVHLRQFNFYRLLR